MADNELNCQIIEDFLSDSFEVGDFTVIPVDSNDLLNIPTQQLFFQQTAVDEASVWTLETPKRKRHANPVSDEEFKQKLQSRIPIKTRQATDWTVKVYQDWAKDRQTQPETLLAPSPVPVDLLDASDEQLNYWFSRFAMEVRRQDGKDYPPNTLSNIMAGIQRYLRDNGRNINLFKKDDPVFLLFRQSLDSRMKELTAAGVGVSKNRADPITEADEDLFWKNVFSENSAQSYSYADFYNCKLFGLRGMDEHRDLQVEQFVVSNDPYGKYVQFTGRVSKNVQGGLNNRKVEPKCIKQYADSTNPRCVVQLYEKYLSFIQSGVFYRRPLPTKPGDVPNYGQQAVGVNTLSQYMKRMCDKAYIDRHGRNISNHSGKVTCCTNLYNAGFTDKAVKSRSGHRSNAVQVYQRETNSMLKEISKALQPPRPKPTCTVTCQDKENDAADSTLYQTTLKQEVTERFVHSSIECAKTGQEKQCILKIVVPESVNCVEIEKCGKKVKLEI